MPDEYSEIQTKQGEIEEHRIKIQTSPIDFMLRKVTLDVADISMMEYSKRFESRHNIGLYIDNIIDSYNKRDAEQFSLIQNKIKGSNLYDLDMEDKELAQTSSNGYSDNAENSVTTEKHDLENGNILGLLETSILWLEVINSNFNDLLGLVSASNYLAGISVLNTNTLEDINLILGGEPLGIKFINDENTILGRISTSTTNGIDGYNDSFDDIVTTLDTISENTQIIIENTESSLLDSISSIAALVAAIATAVAVIPGAHQAVAIPVAVIAYAVAALPYIIDLYNDFTTEEEHKQKTSASGEAFWGNLGYRETTGLEKQGLLTNYSTMSNQSESDFATIFGESEEFTKQFTEAFETSFRTNFETSYNTIYNSYLEELEKWNTLDTLYAPNKTTGKQNTYTNTLLSYTTGENKKNTNAITSEDLYNNIYNERNYGEQKVEHIYNMPITNNTTVNVKNEPDYEKVTSHVIKSMSNGLHSVAAARGRLMLD